MVPTSKSQLVFVWKVRCVLLVCSSTVCKSLVNFYLVVFLVWVRFLDSHNFCTDRALDHESYTDNFSVYCCHCMLLSSCKALFDQYKIHFTTWIHVKSRVRILRFKFSDRCRHVVLIIFFNIGSDLVLNSQLLSWWQATCVLVLLCRFDQFDLPCTTKSDLGWNRDVETF
jgi:hypothetical protein